MKKALLTYILIVLGNICHAQRFDYIKHDIEAFSVYAYGDTANGIIPIYEIIAVDPKDSITAQKINRQLLDHLELNDYKSPAEVPIAVFRNIEELSPIRFIDNAVVINYEMYDNTGLDYTDTRFYDLDTGTELKDTTIPTYAYFTEDGYIKWLNDMWHDYVFDALDKEGYFSHGREGYYIDDIEYFDRYNNGCSLFHTKNSWEPGTLHVSLADCYIRYHLCCSPSYSHQYTYAEIEPLLSEFGKQILAPSSEPMNAVAHLRHQLSCQPLIKEHLYAYVNLDGETAIISFNINNDNITGTLYLKNTPLYLLEGKVATKFFHKNITIKTLQGERVGVIKELNYNRKETIFYTPQKHSLKIEYVE